MLTAVSFLASQFPHLRYAIVGQQVTGYDLIPLIAELGLTDVVRLTDYVPQELYQQDLSAADIGINLRHPTLGETSGPLHSLMGYAKPVLVSDLDAFAELPDDACVKIPVHEEIWHIEQALQFLIHDEGERIALGERAAVYAQTTCAPDRIAQLYADFLASILV